MPARSGAGSRMNERGDRPSQRTLVIIPTYNERENLPLIVGRVHAARPEVDVLVVDDGSPDGTGELADELSLADPDRVHVMHRTEQGRPRRRIPRGFRLGPRQRLLGAGRDGCRRLARPEELYRLLDAVDAGADLAIGSRYVPGGDRAQLAATADGAVATRQRLLPRIAGRRRQRHHRRLPGVPARGAARRSISQPSTRRATASRWS